MTRSVVFAYLAGIASIIAIFGILAINNTVAEAQSGQLTTAPEAVTSPTGTVEDRDVYYPGTEALAPDEMRIVALGTGMPSARPKQAAACWLAELGNGDKFLFDIGAGCAERLAAQKIPYDYLNKVFIGHLHVDHMGDLPALWLGGTVMNRLVPLRIWGPSGGTPEYGTQRSMEMMEKMYVWDIGTRSGVIDFRGGELEINKPSVRWRHRPQHPGRSQSRRSGQLYLGMERTDLRLWQRYISKQMVYRTCQGRRRRCP
jgi:hypothetical protein